MTVQEVTEQIQEYDKVAGLMMNIPHDVCMAIIESLSELEQYRALGTPTQILERIGGLDVELGKYHCLGTVEELKEAREKQIPQTPCIEGDGYCPEGNLVYDTWICPNCEEHYEIDYHDYDYCPKCGQAINREIFY